MGLPLPFFHGLPSFPSEESSRRSFFPFSERTRREALSFPSRILPLIVGLGHALFFFFPLVLRCSSRIPRGSRSPFFRRHFLSFFPPFFYGRRRRDGTITSPLFFLLKVSTQKKRGCFPLPSFSKRSPNLPFSSSFVNCK